MDINKYTFVVQWDNDDEIYVARVLEFASLAAHGDSHEEALRELKGVVQAVVEELIEEGGALPEPFSTKMYSGRFNVRLPVELHRQLAINATLQGVSLNQLVLNKLSR